MTPTQITPHNLPIIHRAISNTFDNQKLWAEQRRLPPKKRKMLFSTSTMQSLCTSTPQFHMSQHGITINYAVYGNKRTIDITIGSHIVISDGHVLVYNNETNQSSHNSHITVIASTHKRDIVIA